MRRGKGCNGAFLPRYFLCGLRGKAGHAFIVYNGRSAPVNYALRIRAENRRLRRRYLLGELRSMGLECFEPEGAFYIFPSIESTGLSSEEFCERLLHEQEVAVIPGSAFGASGEGHIRISYSYSMSHLREACSRMKIFLENLKQEQK